MNEELMNKIKELEKEIAEIKERYGQIHDYKLISAIFDKLGLDEIKLTFDEVNNSDAIYIVEHNSETKTVTVRKKIDGEDLEYERSK